MNKIAEIFWILFGMVIGIALLMIAAPFVALLVFLGLALPPTLMKIYRKRVGESKISQTHMHESSGRRLSSPTIETSYSVLPRS